MLLIVCGGIVNQKKMNIVNQTLSMSVDGGWSQWVVSARTECSKTCGTGSQTITETRTCTNPSPSGPGARPCSGDSRRTSAADCIIQACTGKCHVFHGYFAELCLDVSA